ncbi:MAG: Hsp20/alpha crystallin family protein [Candidatus Sigynarchaeum springense]
MADVKKEDKTAEERKKIDVKVDAKKGTAIAERRVRSPFKWIEAMDRLFNRALSDWFYTPFEDVMSISLPEYRMPMMDIEESETEYKVRAELPGLAKDDIKVELEGDVLRISAEKKESSEKKEKHYVRKERYHESFYREIRLPEDIDMTKDIEAKLENGLLNITIKRVAPARVEKREIKVQ